MKLRRRLLVTMIALVAIGLAALDLITLTSLHSYLYGRVDAQLSAASRQIVSFVGRADARGFAVTPTAIGTHVGPDLYVEIIDPAKHAVVTRPSSTQSRPDPAPALPTDLPVLPAVARDQDAQSDRAYRPRSDSVTVSSLGGHGPQYRLQATSLPGGTLVVATPLTAVNATLRSLRAIELAVSLGLLVALLLLMTLLIRQGLRPLEAMAKEADAIAAGDLTRRVEPTEGDGEIARLGRALNGMLAQIETAFAQRALSEDRLRSFLADASHELRTPLTSIRGYAELLRKDALQNDADRDRALARIEKEAARMGSLVGDLSVLAREGEGPRPARHRVDLAAVAAEAVADAKSLDATRPIDLHASGEVPVWGDEARLEQMVHNLVGNAMAHTPKGTPVAVRVAVQGGRAVLDVADRGPGMSPEQARHVFDRFYRGDGDRLDGGSGLGLYIVATLARTFGGSATVDTEIGQGCTFRVDLPAYNPPLPDPPTHVQPAATTGGGSRQDAGLH